MRTKEQVNEDENARKMEREKAKLNAAVEYNYNRLKKEIVDKAQNGDFEHGTITGRLEIKPGVDRSGYNFDASGEPYDRDLFDWERLSKSSFNSLFGTYAAHDFLQINNVQKLLEVHKAMSEMGALEGIKIGEPYLYSFVYDRKDWAKLKILREKKTKIVRGKLSADVNYKYAQHLDKKGERGEIIIAMDYEYTI